VNSPLVDQVRAALTAARKNRETDRTLLFSTLLSEFGNREIELGHALSDAEALEVVVSKGYSMAFGARFLKRVIDERIKLPISSQWQEGSHFHVRVRDGAAVVEPVLAQLVDTKEALAFGDVA